MDNPDDYEYEHYDYIYSNNEKRKELEERADSIWINNLWWDRSNPILIQVIEELGEKASTVHSKLEIIEIKLNENHIDKVKDRKHLKKFKNW